MSKKIRIGRLGKDYNETIVKVLAIVPRDKVVEWFKANDKDLAGDVEEHLKDDDSRAKEFYCTVTEFDNPKVPVKKGEYYMYPTDYDFSTYWGLDPYDNPDDMRVVTMFYNCRSEEEASWQWGNDIVQALKENDIEHSLLYPSDEPYECNIMAHKDDMPKVKIILNNISINKYIKEKLKEKGYDSDPGFSNLACEIFNDNDDDVKWQIVLELVAEQTLERQKKFWDEYFDQLISNIKPVKEFKPIEKFPHVIKDLKACYQLTLYPSISPKGRYELYTYDEDEGRIIMNFSIDDGKLTYYYGNFDGIPDSYADEVVERMCNLFNVPIDGKGWENKNIIFKN